MIDGEVVARIARLARLSITPEEARAYRGQLADILEHMRELESLDTSGVPPTSSVIGPTDAAREDSPRTFEAPEKLLANAPRREGPFFRVPKVL